MKVSDIRVSNIGELKRRISKSGLVWLEKLYYKLIKYGVRNEYLLGGF